MSTSDIKPEITSMINEVNLVLKKHLSTLLNPILSESEKTQNVLLNIPYVKNLHDENIRKDNIIKKLSQKLEEFGKGSLKLEVSEVDNIEKSFLKNRIELAIEKENKKITPFNLNNCSSDDSYTYSDESDENMELSTSPEISSILENLKKAKQNYESPIVKQFNSFTLLDNTDEEDEEDDEKENAAEEEDEEDDEQQSADEEQSAEEKDEEEDEEEDNEDEEEDEEEDDEEEDNEEENDEKKADKKKETSEVEDDDSEDEGLEVEEVTINGKQYLTDDKINGDIYKCDADGEILFDKNDDFIIVGKFTKGKAIFI